MRTMRTNVYFIFEIVFFFRDVSGICYKLGPTKPRSENKDVCLRGFEYFTFKSPKLEICEVQCLSNKICKSVNFHETKKICALNNESERTVGRHNFQICSGAIHVDVMEMEGMQGYLGKCMNHNCPTETVCVPAPSGTKTRYSCLKQDSCKNAKFCPVPSDADMYLQPSNIVEPICNGITIIDGGPVTLKSPDKDGDGYYDNLVDCVWKFEVSSGHIKITTQAFKLEWKIDCGYDWLTIRDNGTEHGPFCGTTIMSELTSISLDLEVVFRTDINSVSTGFSFTVENV